MPRKCEHPDCMKAAFFNVIDSELGRFCSSHKEVGMVDVKHKSCEHPGCNKRPYFNVPGSEAGMFCSEHKHEGMVNIIIW